MENSEIPKVPDQVPVVVEDNNHKFLLKWKELFHAINPKEIEVYIHGEKDFPDDRTIEKWSQRIEFQRINDLVRDSDIRLVVVFSGALAKKISSRVGLGLIRDRAFLDRSVFPLEDPDWLDSIEETTTWKEMLDEVIRVQNIIYSEIPNPE